MVDILAISKQLSEGGMKYDDGKLRPDYIPPYALTQLAEVLTFGAKKYEAHSWRTVPNAKERYFAALMRHMLAYHSGEQDDEETGLPHMAHIMCNAAFLTELDND